MRKTNKVRQRAERSAKGGENRGENMVRLTFCEALEGLLQKIKKKAEKSLCEEKEENEDKA